MKTSNVSFLLEEALLLTEERKFKGLLLEDLQSLDENLSDEDFDLLYEALSEDEDLLVEFLGTIAGLGSKAAKWVGSKASKLGSKLGAYSAKSAAASKAKKDKKELAGVIKTTRSEHTNAVKAYGKALKGKDPKAQKAALAALKIARNNSRIARGKSQLTGRAPGKKVGKQRMDDLQKTLASRRKTSIYKRLGEAVMEMVVEDLLTEGSGNSKRVYRVYKSKKRRNAEHWLSRDSSILRKKMDSADYRSNRRRWDNTFLQKLKRDSSSVKKPKSFPVSEGSGDINKKTNKKLKKLYPSDDPRSGEGEWADPFKKKRLKKPKSLPAIKKFSSSIKKPKSLPANEK